MPLSVMDKKLGALRSALEKNTGRATTRVMRPASQDSLDIAFVFDTTGSMYRCLEEVRRELTRLAVEVSSSIPNTRIGVVAFGDYCDAATTYVTKVLDFTSDVDELRRFIQQVEPTDGEDEPEAVEEAFYEVSRLNWRIGSQRVAVLVGDAPPHGVIDALSNSPRRRDYRREVASLGQKGIKIYPIQCGGSKATERVFREFAQQTGGVYLRLDNMADLVDLLIGICMKQTGLLGAYRARLKLAKRLTESKSRLLKALAAGPDAH